ncbi:RAMP superfamily CRISPR-associated protein [Desulfobacter latus]|uniref:CRISPR-associated protein n=1 Tax=Desulfobacter latus TaxID=2292 RepID=A0A850SYS6_9BACT|nr:RAMP superfamily CRISPR-associated protein [Desulfobacter latus]NWH03871.1 CRISPR-associated protein [Desulfobacter latus]
METIKFETYPLRYLAQITFEARTPLSLSSGENDIETDSVILKDVNGLPVIPGTSIAGVFRAAFNEPEKNEVKNMFGFQDQENDDGIGSRLIFSDAVFVGKTGEAVEGLVSLNWEDPFYNKFLSLPIRQHVRISHTGGINPNQRGKFDEQVVYSGTRFRCEIELIGNEDDTSQWEKIKQIGFGSELRIGGGTCRGFGDLAVFSWLENVFDLTDPEQRRRYLTKTASMNDATGLAPVSDISDQINRDAWTEYRLELTPENFWYFGSGFGDDEADITPVYEEQILWENDQPSFTQKKLLIPASSVKGAVSHRVAFHYNRLKENFADDMDTNDMAQHAGGNNTAVRMLFGCDLDDQIQKGSVIFSDLYMDAASTKIFNHVSIDRFTGGSLDSALFEEKVPYGALPLPSMHILVKTDVLADRQIKSALENTFDDLTKGYLPLGGGVMRGHGAFTGTWQEVK